ncbi:hypothetical protein [Paremcibacter congregatus]|uniref:hypothetical protein n=1 Tax=Paremcibacter congregatus TaxID=2043170 RepID=UPI0030EDABB3|tara:strand:+ start:2410 stop:2811 length:402 start_codon:yes stop_codon:yes gene_type:complete
MSKHQHTLLQREIILRAQKFLDAESVGYGEKLAALIEQLRAALDSRDLAQAIRTTDLIQGQAGTFGWSLATEVAGWFKRLLNKQKEEGIKIQVNDLFLESFDRILTEQIKTECEAAVTLLLQIEATLKHIKEH